MLGIFLGGVAAAQPTTIPTGQSGPAYQTAVNAALLYDYTNSARPNATMTINGVTITLGTTNTLTLADLTAVWGSGSRPVMADGLGTSGHCAEWGAAGLADAGGACGSGGGSANDFDTTITTGGTVVRVAGGSYRYGTTSVSIAGPLTFTLQTIAIASVVTGGVTTTINTSSTIAAMQDGQSINVHLIGTGAGCAAGTGVFVATKISTTQFTYPADTSAGCTLSSGTIGAEAGGAAIVFGNTAGQIELQHSAALGAIILPAGAGAVVSQTSTGTFPNGTVPIASVTVAAGAFDTATDKRAFLSNLEVQSGAGIDVAMVGGQPQVSVASNIPKTDAPSVWVNSVIMKDATKTLPWRTGSGSPDARDNCTNVGEAYFRTDIAGLYVCTVAGTPGTWSSILGGSGELSWAALTPTDWANLTSTQWSTLLP